MNPNKQVSEVWTYFCKVDNENAKCSICDKLIACKGSSTSGLSRHLDSAHEIKVNINKRKQHEDEQHSLKKSKIQKPLTTSILNFTKRQSLAEIVSRLAAIDGFSINGICKSQFIRQALRERQFNLTIDNKNVMKLIYDYFEVARQQIIVQIEQLKKSEAKFSLTLDEWTSIKNRRYINVNIHTIGGDVINLGLTKIIGSCPAEVALGLVDQKLNEFGLSAVNDIVASTTDGASVMRKFGRNSPYYHQQCYNHAIHLAVLDVIYKNVEVSVSLTTDETEKNYSDSENSSFSSTSYNEDVVSVVPILRPDFKAALDSVRKIVRLFKLSPVKNAILQNYIKTEHGRELNLLLDCKVRWNSIETMLDRFFKVLDCILKAITDLNCSTYWNHDFKRPLQDLLNVLKPIKIAVEALGRRDSNLITSEGIIIFLYKTLEGYDSNVAKELLESIKKRIMERRNIDLVSLLKYLQNPDSYASNENKIDLPISPKSVITKLIKEFMHRIFSNNNMVRYSEEETIEEVFDSDCDIDIVEVNKNVLSTRTEEALKKQLSLAIKESQTIKQPTTNNYNKTIQKEMLIFEGTGNLTPNLLKLFNALKTIQPTSTESERVFSTSSNFCSKKRANLTDKSLNILSFLKSYFLRNDKQ